MQGEGKGTEDEVLRKLMREFPSIASKASGMGDDTRAFAYLVAWLNTRLESAGLGRVIVTGGFAVELLTGRVYRTMDAGFIAEGRAAKVLEGLLSSLGEKDRQGVSTDPELFPGPKIYRCRLGCLMTGKYLR